jgi:hypothetical protein
MTSTAPERPVTVRPPMSERSADGLLAGLALGLLPAELNVLAVMRWLPAGRGPAQRRPSRSTPSGGGLMRPPQSGAGW